MTIRSWLLVTSAAVAATLIQSGLDPAQAAGKLAGQVASAEEGAMEGVVVSAKKNGSTIAVSVVSDDKGNFAFPAAKLEPGQYTLRIRAIGYELDGPKTVDVGEDGAPVSLKLRKARNLAAQLTSAEWMASFPGTPQQKAFMDRCTSCHTYERIAKSSYDADGFINVLQRMGSYAPGTTPLEPQRRKEVRERTVMDPERLRPRAEFLASLNLSDAPQWQYPLKTAAAPQRTFDQGRLHRVRPAARDRDAARRHPR